MIISASRRTDIPAFYSEWFFNRIKAGFVFVRNPINPKSVSRIVLSPDVVDGIVLWTKNPKPMVGRLGGIKDYPYYFQFTLTPYGNDVETNLPEKTVIIDTFRELSDKIGANRVIWRYDPILINDKYTIKYHTERFTAMAAALNGYTKRCVISFADYYKSIAANIKELGLQTITGSDMQRMAESFAAAAGEYGFKIVTCAEAVDLAEYGIGHAKCVDAGIFSQITGLSYNAGKDKNQRAECGCDESIDIGAYNTCPGGCLYCYANHSAKLAGHNRAQYDAASPMLCDRVKDGDVIKNRDMKPLRNGQIGFDLP